jgi:ureidoglycolate lyase
MPILLQGPSTILRIQAQLLNGRNFAEFGDVIENPAPSLVPSLDLKTLPLNAVQANQGSALKFLDVSHMKDLYASAPSKQLGKAVMNMFVCAPRPLIPTGETKSQGLFPIRILERHPFTTQTFVPLGISASEACRCRYLVIVAPSLQPSSADEDLPVPSPINSSGLLPGRGLPDLSKIKAFYVDGSQAVTYGPGTWHAPMVVIGDKPIDFVVVQFSNGVAIEDCQEAELYSNNSTASQIVVDVPEPVQARRLWKL